MAKKPPYEPRHIEPMPMLDSQYKDTAQPARPTHAELKISTYKHSGNLMTRCTVHFAGGGFHTHRLYQDYSQVWDAQPVRATRKAIDTMHTDAMNNLETIKAAACKHYGVALVDPAGI